LATIIVVASQIASSCVAGGLPSGQGPGPNLIVLVRKRDHRGLARALAGGASSRPVSGKSPLVVAAALGDEEAVRILLKYKADANASGGLRLTPLGAAVYSDNSRIVRDLIGAGARPDGRDFGDCPPLCLAHSAAVLRILLRAGANIECKCLNGEGPLHGACNVGNLATTEFLLSHGSRVNATGSAGETPLMEACQADLTRRGTEGVRLQIVRKLLSFGANPAIKDSEGRSARDWAVQSHFSRIAALLATRTGSQARIRS
jgi:ankyrin repeat protein